MGIRKRASLVSLHNTSGNNLQEQNIDPRQVYHSFNTQPQILNTSVSAFSAKKKSIDSALRKENTTQQSITDILNAANGPRVVQICVHDDSNKALREISKQQAKKGGHKSVRILSNTGKLVHSKKMDVTVQELDKKKMTFL